jgi:hypothetical protein
MLIATYQLASGDSESRTLKGQCHEMDIYFFEGLNHFNQYQHFLRMR